jgi:hypothetical protein
MALPKNPGVALAFCALIACVWLNQGPSAESYDALASEVASGGHPWLTLWQPFAFAYRRAQGEEVYYAVTQAVRGARFDADVLLRDRGAASAAFERLPPADGLWHLPYRDVPFEYPAATLPFIGLPAAFASSFQGFALLFGALMGALVVTSVALVVGAPRDLPGEERARRLWLAAALFLAQGGVLVQRIDAVPALFLGLAMWAAIRRRPFVLGLGVGLAGAAKVLPLVVLLPMMMADREAWRGRPRAWVPCLLGALSGVLFGGVLPMVALSPRGLGDFVAYHGARGLQVESTYGVVLSVVELALGRSVAATLSYGSWNLDTPAAFASARLAGPVVGVSVCALLAWLSRLPRPADEGERRDRIACAGLGALLCVWLFGKVFSPQYMTWAIPFVVALGGSRRRGIALALLVAMATAQAYLRGFYDSVTDLLPLGVVGLLVRLGALVVMAVLVGRGSVARRAMA